MGNYAFCDCSKLESVNKPSGITAIKTSAFQNCSNLTTITNLSSVTSLGKDSFQNCQNLTSSEPITLNLSSVPNRAFQYCSKLNFSVNISTSGTKIGDYAFDGCNLTSITFATPSNITSFGEGAFKSSGINTITIPKGVTSLSNNPLENCKSLTAIYVESGSITFISKDGVLFTADGEELVMCPIAKSSYTVPNGTTSIKGSAFYYCKLTSVVIPESVTSIGNSAFCYCYDLKSVTFTGTSQIKSIESSVFYSCSKLSTIQIPDSVESIGFSAFSYSGLTSVTMPNTLKTIGNQAFQNTKLTVVNIPASVTSIGDNSFVESKLIEKFIVSEENSKYCSDDTGALFTKDKKTLINFPPAITGSYEIPSEVENIGKAFYYSNLTTVIISSNVSSIVGYAFSYSKFTTITIPNNIKTINGYVFNGCTELTEVIIQSGVESINDYAFRSCSKLDFVIFKGETPATLGANAFNGCNNIKLLVPLEYNAAYKEKWSSSYEGKIYSCVDDPDVVEGLIYCGEELIGVTENGAYYTFKNSSNRAINAGNYTAIAELVDGYLWSDKSGEDMEILWDILCKDITVKADDKSRTIDHDDPEWTVTITGLVDTFEIAYDITCPPI